MVVVRAEARVNQINVHIAKVEELFSRAVDNLKFYPEESQRALGNVLEEEKAAFDRACELFLNGTGVPTIVKQVCRESRSWLQGSIPKNITQYSHCNVKDLKKRKKIAREQIDKCKERHNAALETIKELRESGSKIDENIESTLKKDRDAFVRAFEMHALGFSQAIVRKVTEEDMCSRLKHMSLPESIVRYAGYTLTEAEQSRRKMIVNRIQNKAVEAFKLATQRHQDSDSFRGRKKEWVEDLKSIKLALALYERGLSPERIKELTDLPANIWILKEVLPVKLARAALDLSKIDYSIPRSFDEPSAYIAGAYFASTRAFSVVNGLTFRTRSKDIAEHVRAAFQTDFELETREPREEGSYYVVDVQSKKFVEDFIGLLGISEDADPLVPYELLKTQYITNAFLGGFFDFAAGSLNVEHRRFSITRVNQDKLLKAIAIALSFMDIYVNITFGKDKSDLYVSQSESLMQLINSFPSIGTSEKREQLKSAIREVRSGQLESYADYCAIMKTLREHFSNGTKLDFSTIIKKSEVLLSLSELTDATKAKIQRWRNGKKPDIARKAESIKGYYAELYPGEL